MKSLLKFAAFAAFALSVSTAAQAMIVYGVSDDDAKVIYDGSATSGQYASVSISSCTATYLGNGWFITANHVSTSVGTKLYQNGSSATVSYIDGSLYTDYGVDLKLFYVEDLSGLDSLTSVSVSSSVSASVKGSTSFGFMTMNGTAVEVVGNGFGRASDSSLTDTSVSYGTSRAIRATDTNVDVATTSDGIKYFVSVANNVSGDMALGSGDSGGGMFVQKSGATYLAGVARGVNNTASGSDDTVAFGSSVSDSSYSMYVSLESYADAINTVVSSNPLVPEPAEYAAMFGAFAFCAALFLRRRK